MEVPATSNSLMSPACGAGLQRRPPAAAFEVRLEHGHLTTVEESVRENPAVLGQLRSGVLPTTVKAIYFSSLKLLTAAALVLCEASAKALACRR